MRRRHLNLAAHPFVNRRPVTRVTLALAFLAAGLLVADGALFWRYYRGREDQREQLRRVEEEIASLGGEIRRLERTLAAVDLEHDNRRAEFLNRKIAERTFGWGQLFDRLTAILPGDVRLVTLAPRTLEDRRRTRRGGAAAAAEEELVRLAIDGIARRDEAILELVDALFADPAFAGPNLSREALEQGETRFNLTVVYRPAVAAAEAAAAPADADAAAGDGAAAGEGGEPAVEPPPEEPRPVVPRPAATASTAAAGGARS